MGHYDDFYENEYDQRRKQDQELRNKEIPQIIDQLDDVRRTIEIFAGEIKKSRRMIEDIEFMILALKAQVE